MNRHVRETKVPRWRQTANVALGILGGTGVSVVTFTGTQLLLGFAWGVVCRVLDCSMDTFMNLWILAPLGVVSILVGGYVGWLVGRKMHLGVGRLA